MSRVSVIIPTRCRPRLLARAIASARSAAADAEIVVVDDASMDATREICRQRADITYVRLDERRMIAGARNAGIRASRSEYLTFLDDDDVRLPGSLDAQIRALDDAPDAAFVYAPALYGDADAVPAGGSWPDVCPQGDIFLRLLEWNFIPCMTVVFRRSAFEEVGALHETAGGVDDWDLWLRLAERFPVIALEQPVAIWRQSSPTSQQYSSQPARMLAVSARLLRERWLELPRAKRMSARDRAAITRRFLDRASGQLIADVRNAVTVGRYGHAARTIWTAARVCPAHVARRLWRGTGRRLGAGLRGVSRMVTAGRV